MILENEALFKVFSTNLGIDKYLILFDKNASTAISLAALRIVGALFFIFKASYASSKHGNFFKSGSKKVSFLLSLIQVFLRN